MGINFQNVSFKYSPLASKSLKNVSLNINEKDEFICILGHTGSGKTTLVQNMNALLLPSGGNIEVFDYQVIKKMKHPLVFNTKKNQIKYDYENNHKLFAKGNKPVYNEHLKQMRKHIGLVFQFPEYQLFESTIIKDVMFGPKNFGYSQEEALSNSKEALNLVGIGPELYDQSPFNISGGQMRKVSIAGILAINPDIIILDEPTVGLDPLGKTNLMDLLTKIQHDTHKTIIMISHDMDIVAKYASRIIVMDQGLKVYDGNKNELFNDSEKLHDYHLDLPTIGKVAEGLKKKGLISYTNIPLTIEELESIILQGDKHE